MTRPWVLLLLTVSLAAVPATAAGQTRRCNQTRPADWRRLVNARGQEIMYFQDPVRLECTGRVSLEADSAVWNRATSDLELVGSVVYRDSTTELTADWANYLGGQDRILSRGDVELRDLGNGSRVTGEQLDYQRQTPTRRVSRLLVQGGRPHAVIRRESEAGAQPGGPRREAPGVVTPEGRRAAAAETPPVGQPVDAAAVSATTPSDTAPPLEVWADLLEFVGDTLFVAERDVVLERGEMTGAADFARYGQATGEMHLRGGAHVENPDYRLEGDQIDALTDGEVLREVLSQGSARLISEDLTVRSERVRIGFVDGAIDRMEAWNPDPESAEHRARAIAEGFDLRADSIDARADSGAIREVRAIGRAYGERDADSLASRLPAVIARDWIQGDTIIGYFAKDTTRIPPPRVTPTTEVDDTALTAADVAELPTVDTTAGEPDSTSVVLERVVVIGGGSPALSLYRMQRDDGAGERSINFMKAQQIILIMSDGEVTKVEAEGPIEGLYLDPVTGEPKPEPEGGAPEEEGGR